MGLGWKRWTRERLPADELQGYLQDQVVAVFPSNSVRDAELGVSDVPEGMHVYVIESGRTLVRVGVGAAGSWQIVAPMPGLELTKAAVQATAAAAWVLVTWDAPGPLPPSGAGMWNSGTPHRLVAAATGRHAVLAAVNGINNLQVRKNSNGSSTAGSMVAGDAISGPAYGQALRREFTLQLGDHLEVFSYRTAAGDVGPVAGYVANFSLSYLGR